jgi:hypothetical protein
VTYASRSPLPARSSPIEKDGRRRLVLTRRAPTVLGAPAKIVSGSQDHRLEQVEQVVAGVHRGEAEADGDGQAPPAFARGTDRASGLPAGEVHR